MPFPSRTDRQAILQAALEQVSRDGVAKLAIRSLANSLGLAPNALYRYFPSLAAIESALADESRRLLHEALEQAADGKSPELAIRGIAEAYVRFAREQPHLFALTLLPSVEEEGEPQHVQMWRFVLDHVEKIYGEERAPEAAVSLWAFLHGITALEAAGVFGERKPESSFEFGLRLWLEASRKV